MKSIRSLFARIFSNPLKECKRNGMKLGKGCSIMSWKIISEAYLIELGDYVQITDGVHLFTHGGGWVLRHYGGNHSDYDSFGRVFIGNNVYIGNNACIMPGVTIGSNVVIGAASVVTKNVPDNVVVAGNPARIINTIDNYIKKMLPYDLHCKHMTDKAKKQYLLNLPSDRFISVNSYLNEDNENSLSHL